MRIQFTRESFIPKAYTLIAKSKDGQAVVFMSVEGKLAAVGFVGKAAKPAFHYTFRTEERRAQYAAEFFRAHAATVARRAARKAERTTFTPSLKVGDVLSTCWGYDQTNREFFEVVELVGKTMCVVRELACQSEQSGFLSETVVPMPGRYTDRAPLRKRILEGNRLDIHNANFGRASLFFRPEPGKLPIIPPQYVSHTH